MYSTMPDAAKRKTMSEVEAKPAASING
jgi:hypothetical protein